MKSNKPASIIAKYPYQGTLYLAMYGYAAILSVFVMPILALKLSLMFKILLGFCAIVFTILELYAVTLSKDRGIVVTKEWLIETNFFGRTREFKCAEIESVTVKSWTPKAKSVIVKMRDQSSLQIENSMVKEFDGLVRKVMSVSPHTAEKLVDTGPKLN